MSAPERTRTTQRIRSSVACTACRIRRTKCIIPPEQNVCTYCKKGGLQCVLKDDDKRKRNNISNADTISLAERVAFLESILSQQAGQPVNRSAINQYGKSPPERQFHPPIAGHHGQGPLSRENSRSNLWGEGEDESLKDESTPFPDLQSPLEVGNGLRYVSRRTSTSMFDDLALSVSLEECEKQDQRSKNLVKEIPTNIKDYLMELFWTHYNNILHVVRRESFEEEQGEGETRFYNVFLHICMMAMGCIFSNARSLRTHLVVVQDVENRLLGEAKSIADCGLSTQLGIPDVQALLILSDMEYMQGRENLGNMYGDMACRTCFEIGLNYDRGHSGPPGRELCLRHLVLCACVVHDRYWALFSGRLTCIESSDFAISKIRNDFDSLGTFKEFGFETSVELQIYRSRLSLLDLAGNIIETLYNIPNLTDLESYGELAKLDREMNAWYSTLPELLKWTPSNVKVAPLSFFHLHQEYHSILILLHHRPFASYAKMGQRGITEVNADIRPLFELSQNVCFDNAVRVSRIFQQRQEKVGTRQVTSIGIQHAGTAAIAILSGLLRIKNSEERRQALDPLHCLVQALQTLSKSCPPAERLVNHIKRVFRDLGWALKDLAAFGSSSPTADEPYLYNTGAPNFTRSGPSESESLSHPTSSITTELHELTPVNAGP